MLLLALSLFGWNEVLPGDLCSSSVYRCRRHPKAHDLTVGFTEVRYVSTRFKTILNILKF